MTAHIFLNSYEYASAKNKNSAEFSSTYSNDVMVSPEPKNKHFVTIKSQVGEVTVNLDELRQALEAIKVAVR